MARALITLPATAKRGELIEIRVLVSHPMETGFRRDTNGQTIPMHIVNQLSVQYGGRQVFSAELGTGVSTALRQIPAACPLLLSVPALLVLSAFVNRQYDVVRLGHLVHYLQDFSSAFGSARGR